MINKFQTSLTILVSNFIEKNGDQTKKTLAADRKFKKYSTSQINKALESEAERGVIHMSEPGVYTLGSKDGVVNQDLHEEANQIVKNALSCRPDIEKVWALFKPFTPYETEDSSEGWDDITQSQDQSEEVAA